MPYSKALGLSKGSMRNCIFCLPSFYKDRERLFKRRKVHIKSEFWKNAAITLSIKNLKGFWEVVLCQPYTVLVLNIANTNIYFLFFSLLLDSYSLSLLSKTTDCNSSSSFQSKTVFQPTEETSRSCWGFLFFVFMPTWWQNPERPPVTLSTTI